MHGCAGSLGFAGGAVGQSETEPLPADRSPVPTGFQTSSYCTITIWAVLLKSNVLELVNGT